jgi:hypothetical protein
MVSAAVTAGREGVADIVNAGSNSSTRAATSRASASRPRWAKASRATCATELMGFASLYPSYELPAERLVVIPRSPLARRPGMTADRVARIPAMRRLPVVHFSSCAVGQITTIFPRVPHPIRGAARDRHGRWSGMRWTRRVAVCVSHGRTAWRGRRNRVVLTPLGWRQVRKDASRLADDGDNKAWSPAGHRGEHV